MKTFLDPLKSRHHLLDLVRPPGGYKLDAAIGTTYSLELPVLLTVLIELAGQVQDEAIEDSQVEDDTSASTDSVNDEQGLSSLIAVKKLLDRVKVFTHRGGIKSLRRTNGVTSILDQFIEEIHVRGAAFHPKVWVLAYKHKENGQLFHRLICMSRNLSSARQHEVGVVLEQSSGRNKGYQLPELAQFLKLLHSSTEGAITELIERIASGNVRFSSPVDRWKPSFIFQRPNNNEHLLKHLPKRGGNILVISPFVTKEMVTLLKDRYGTQSNESIKIVSMTNELRKLELVANDNPPSKVFAFDQIVLEDGTGEDGLLHAKLLLYESSIAKELFIGSANWTKSAWHGRNWEAMIKLTGPAEDNTLQVDDLLENLITMGASPFTHTEITELERDVIQADKLASEWLGIIAGLTFRGEWRKRENSSIELCVKIEGDILGITEITGTFRPFPHGAFRSIRDLSNINEFIFELRNEMDCSKFLEFEVQTTVGNANVKKKCLMLIVIPETDEQRENRIDRVIASYLVDPNKFWDALLHILMDDFPDEGGDRLPEPSRKDNESISETDVFPFEELNLELLLKACYDDEEKVRAVNSIIDGAKAAPDKENHPAWQKIAAFIQLWSLIVEAREGIINGTKAVSTKVRKLDSEAVVPADRRKRAKEGAARR